MKETSYLHLLVLFLILAGGSVMFWYGQGNIPMQLAAGSLTAVAYVAWGIIHHAIAGNLHRNVVIEYVLVGLIAIVLLTTLAI